MNYETLIRERYSVRDYKDTPIEEEKLAGILEAGRIAPTAGNRQPQRIYVLKSPEALAKIREITPCAFNAPVVLMFGYNAEEQWTNPQEEGICAGQQDASIVATHIMLEAWNLGIGSCWVNRFPNTETAKVFNLPENEKLVLLMPLGYPSEKAAPGPKHPVRKELNETVKEL